MQKKWRNILIGVLIAAAVVVLLVVLLGGDDDFHEKYAGVDLSSDTAGIGRSNTYDAYLTSRDAAHDLGLFEAQTGDPQDFMDGYPADAEAVPAADEQPADETAEAAAETAGLLEENLQADAGAVDAQEEAFLSRCLPAWHGEFGTEYAQLSAGETANWSVTIDETGYYELSFVYAVAEGVNAENVSYSFRIDGAPAFEGADALVLPVRGENGDEYGFVVTEGHTPVIVIEEEPEQDEEALADGTDADGETGGETAETAENEDAAVSAEDAAADAAEEAEVTAEAEEEIEAIPAVTRELQPMQREFCRLPGETEAKGIKLSAGTYTVSITALDNDIYLEAVHFTSYADRPEAFADADILSARVESDETVEAKPDEDGDEAFWMGDRKVLAFKKGTDADGAEFDYVYTGDKGAVTFTVNVEAAGFYNIRLDYLTVESRGVDVERVLYINGELPFTGASTLCFSRLWTDKVKQKAVAEDGTVYYDAAVTVSGDDITVMKNGTVVYEGKGKVEEYTVKIDNQGNEIRPTQVEVYDWQTAYCRDDMGYELLPYQFYFNKGENTVTLEAVNEPFCIRGIHLVPVAELADYERFSASQAGREENDGTALIIVEGESAGLRSTPSLYPKYDRSSPDTYPYSVSKTLLNYIGGDAWNKANEWIEWSFEVDEPGYYLITIKGRQKYQRGAISCRSVYIDGEIPCEELSAVEFDYSTSWQNCTLKDANGDPCRFWLDKGTHTIRIEATLGAMGPILKEIEDSIYRLNQIYRKVLVLTGVNPDRFRDYNIAKTLPGVIEAMDLESRRLYRIVDETVEVTGQKSDRIAVAQTLASQLEKFVKNNDRITEQFTNFKDNITSLGTSMQNMSETKLDIDRIYIHGDKAELPDIHDGFFAGLVHEVKSCAASYFVDYNSLGDKYDEDEDDIIDVWIVTGRDQSTILKTMIDDTFTPEFGVKVNVKLVVADTLLTAVVAGNGPDVVLSLASWFPVNYAMRNAVEDLTQFDDFWDVIYGEGNWTPGEDGVPVAVDDSKAVFYPSSLVAMTYTSYSEDENGEKTIPHEGIYALPETQEYNLLFYREDVLEELGLNVPQTWEELVAMLPTIQGNNMSVGVPYPDIAAADMSVLNSLIYQHGGQIYDGDGKSTMIDNESGVQAFELYTSLYNDYGLPIVYDFVSRFRSGEMPLGVTSYTTYNTLAIAAPEIRGLWNFTYFPGTEQADGSIDRSVHAQGVCCMMIKTDDERIRNDAWTFMKWWTSADTQVRFGREIESVLGSSARYSTANRQALKQLAWSSEQLEVLQGQQAWTVGFREIAGGYSTTRHMTNAIRKVINEKEDKRETLINYARTINEEIRIKRQEFGLPLE